MFTPSPSLYHPRTSLWRLSVFARAFLICCSIVTLHFLRTSPKGKDRNRISQNKVCYTLNPHWFYFNFVRTAFLLLQIRWSKLIGKMWDRCFAMHPPSYRDVFNIEEDIKRFELDLPSSFRLPTLQAATEHPCVLFQVRPNSLNTVDPFEPIQSEPCTHFANISRAHFAFEAFPPNPSNQQRLHTWRWEVG